MSRHIEEPMSEEEMSRVIDDFNARRKLRYRMGGPLEPLACPLCGHESAYGETWTGAACEGYVMCKDLTGCRFTITAARAVQAVEKWNKLASLRASLAAAREREQWLEEACRECLKVAEDCYEATGHFHVAKTSRQRMKIESLLALAEPGADGGGA